MKKKGKKENPFPKNKIFADAFKAIDNVEKPSKRKSKKSLW